MPRPLPGSRATCVLLLQTKIARSATRRRDVAIECVIHHHAVSVEAPAESANGTLHAFDPATRKPVAIALVVERNHFFAKHSHHVVSIASVMNVHIGVSSAVANGEAVQAVIGLSPPSIEHRKIQAAV